MGFGHAASEQGKFDVVDLTASLIPRTVRAAIEPLQRIKTEHRDPEIQPTKAEATASVACKLLTDRKRRRITAEFGSVGERGSMRCLTAIAMSAWATAAFPTDAEAAASSAGSELIRLAAHPSRACFAGSAPVDRFLAVH